MPKLLIYSCVTGGYDSISASLLASVVEPGVSYVLYTDDKVSVGSAWEVRPLIWRHPLCQRRTARWHKVNSHLVCGEFEHTLWLDGSQRIRAAGLLDSLPSWYGDHSVASFKHPERTCVYQEFQACRQLLKDNSELMQQQVGTYRASGYPPFNGLAETSCVLRKSTAEIAQFNMAWWRELAAWSYRDQLSFNCVAHRCGLKCGVIPGCRSYSPFFEYVPHGGVRA